MIVISLALVIAAAVSLFIGLVVVTDTLTFIFAAIVLCLVSLVLLWLGTRSRTSSAPTAPSAPVYGGGARAGGSTTPARSASADDLDELTAPEGGTVVRKTAARDRAASRVSEKSTAKTVGDRQQDTTSATAAAADVDSDAGTPAPDADVAPAPAEKAPAKKATKKATSKKAAKKSAKKATSKKATSKKATRKSAAKKSTATKSTARKATAAGTGTTGADARARLSQISGVGPAKQDALLARYGSLEGIRDASVDDIVSNVKGFGTALASRVKDELS